MKKAKKPSDFASSKGQANTSDLSKLIDTFKNTAKTAKTDEGFASNPENKNKKNGAKQENSIPALDLPVYSKTTYSDILNKHNTLIKKIRQQHPSDKGSDNVNNKIVLSDKLDKQQEHWPTSSKPKFIKSKPVSTQALRDTKLDTGSNIAVIAQTCDSCSCNELPLYPPPPGSDQAASQYAGMETPQIPDNTLIANKPVTNAANTDKPANNTANINKPGGGFINADTKNIKTAYTENADSSKIYADKNISSIAAVNDGNAHINNDNTHVSGTIALPAPAPDYNIDNTPI